MRTASLRFEILKSISWEIFASIKLIMKKNREDPKKHFKHIIEWGSRLKIGQKWVQK